MHYPGDLDLNDPVNLPPSERPAGSPASYGYMLPSNRVMSNYHHDPLKLIGTLRTDNAVVWKT